MAVVSYLVVGVSPRTLGRQHAPQIAAAGAAVLLPLSRILGPLPRALIVLGNALTPGKGFREGPFATEAELRAAVKHASLDGLAASLPKGLDSPVGERGTSLSGGQRQRVAIARAFLKDAPILILDEATSHLDAVNEQAVRRALDLLQTDRTTIVIAHRLSTVRDADLIVVLDQGSVVETGTHASLVARGGLYARLVSRQLSSAYAPAAS